jgi:hypothetical protein
MLASSQLCAHSSTLLYFGVVKQQHVEVDDNMLLALMHVRQQVADTLHLEAPVWEHHHGSGELSDFNVHSSSFKYPDSNSATLLVTQQCTNPSRTQN